MANKVIPRDISPLLQKLRNFLLGRQHTNALRFEPFVAKRTQPPPEIPGGSANKLSANYYYARDARREVIPPIDVTATQLLHHDTNTGKDTKTQQQVPTPGKIFHWDHHNYS